MKDQSLILRAMEIASTSAGPMTSDDAMAQAVVERYGNDAKAIARAYAGAVKGWAKDAAKSNHNLPEQLTLFSALPALLVINDGDNGHLFMPKEQASAGQVRGWISAGERMHATQAKRFKAMASVFDAAGFELEGNFEAQARGIESES